MPRSRQPLEVWRETRRRIWERDKGICQSSLQSPLCRGKQGELTLKTCHVEHIISGKWGTNHHWNLRVQCRACHVLREDMRHRGMIAPALKASIIPPNWRELIWDYPEQLLAETKARCIEYWLKVWNR